MNFVDATLVLLADPVRRAGLFDEIALGHLIAAAYDTEAMKVQPPYKPVFDEFRLGFAVPRLGTVEGAWNPAGSAKVDARFHFSGIGDTAVPRVDAFWRGAVVARTVPVTSWITGVEVEWPDAATIDSEIVADLGSMPADPDTLEQERRARFLARIRSALDQPEVFTDGKLDEWLESVGATSMGDLLTRFQGTVHGGAVQVTFSPPDSKPPSPRQLPVSAVLLIRDGGFSVAQLLVESKMIREQLKRLGIERPKDPSLRLREDLIVVWVIPVTVFDDEDWPGGEAGMNEEQLRLARRNTAGEWLAREGIGLVAAAVS